jgi:hypothetical protein
MLGFLPLLIVRDLDILRAVGRPSEANTKLIVDPNAILSGAVPLEGFKPVARRDSKILERGRDFKLEQLSPRD